MYALQKIEKNAMCSPESMALECEGKKTSFGELISKKNTLAALLSANGCGQGDIIGVTCERKEAYVVSILAVHNIGAAFVPICLDWPKERINVIIGQLNLSLLISTESLLSEISVPCVNYDNALKNKTGKIVETPAIGKDDLAYILFTSGSTGMPKGVKVSQGALACLIENLQRRIGINKNDILLSQAAFNFDMSIADIFWPLASGASIYIGTEKELQSPFLLIELLDKKNITVLQATASWYRYLFSAGWSPDKKYKILCGGEAFPYELTASMLSCATDLWNMYGPTEATVWVSAQKILAYDQVITIGEAFNGNSYSIVGVDEDGTGELVISGEQVALGYISLNASDHEKFSNDPASGIRSYKSGDLVETDNSGQLVFLGRSDRQIKIRGYRVELDEIEAVLLRYSGVNKAAVVYFDEPEKIERIVAIVECSNKNKCDTDNIKAFCSEWLPAYMLPSEIVSLAQLPVTRNFKIDYSSLRQLLRQSDGNVEKQQESVPECTELREKVQSAWEKHLKVLVGPEDDFFKLGGTSLLAIQVLGEISKFYSHEIALEVFLKYPVFEQFLKELRNNQFTGNLTASDVLIPLKKGLPGSTNIFFIHAIGGHVVNYYRLSSALAEKFTAFGLRAIGVDGKAKPLKSIEEMAQLYIREIKKAQPEGPYILAGGSMGGVLAFEMACQLQERGEVVEKLLMFDTYTPASYTLIQRNESETGGRVRQLKKEFVNGRVFSYLYNGLCSKAYKHTAVLLGNACVRMGLIVPEKYRYEWVKNTNRVALSHYRPSVKYVGNIFMIRAGGEKKVLTYRSETDWGAYTRGRVYVDELEGASHSNMLESEGIARLVLNQLLKR